MGYPHVHGGNRNPVGWLSESEVTFRFRSPDRKDQWNPKKRALADILELEDPHLNIYILYYIIYIRVYIYIHICVTIYIYIYTY